MVCLVGRGYLEIFSEKGVDFIGMKEAFNEGLIFFFKMQDMKENFKKIMKKDQGLVFRYVKYLSFCILYGK